MSFTSFLVAVEERGELRAREAQGLDPLGEHPLAGAGQPVRPLGGAGQIAAPFGLDDALALQPAQEAVQVAHIDALAARELRHELDQLVAVPRPLPEEEQQRRLDEPLDARPHSPLVRPDPAPGAVTAPVTSPVHAWNLCFLHLYFNNKGTS